MLLSYEQARSENIGPVTLLFPISVPFVFRIIHHREAVLRKSIKIRMSEKRNILMAEIPAT